MTIFSSQNEDGCSSSGSMEKASLKESMTFMEYSRDNIFQTDMDLIGWCPHKRRIILKKKIINMDVLRSELTNLHLV